MLIIQRRPPDTVANLTVLVTDVSIVIAVYSPLSDAVLIVYAAPLKTSRGITRESLEKIFADNPMEKSIRKEKNAEHKIEYIYHDYIVRIVDKACEGLEEILSLKEEQDYVYVTGSLYLAGEIKEQINPKGKDIRL